MLLVHWHLTWYQYIIVRSKFPATSYWPLVDSNQVSTGSVHMDNKGKPHRSGSWMTSWPLCHILLEHIWDMVSRCIHALKPLLQFCLNWKLIYIESGSSPPSADPTYEPEKWDDTWRVPSSGYMEDILATESLLSYWWQIKTQCGLCLPWNSHIQYEYADTN